MKTFVLPAASLLLAFAVPAIAGPGSPDPSFGGMGYATGVVGDQATAQGVVVQPDGAVVSAGSRHPSGGGAAVGFFVTRHLANGTLDPAFGVGGVVETLFSSDLSVAEGLALQPDGRIVVAGWATGAAYGSSYDFAVARYLPDGSLDPSFGGDGRVTTDLGNYDNGEDVAIQPDGKIVLVGVSGGALGIVRYLPDGSLDPSFDGDGIVTTFIPGNLWALGVAIQADGKLVVVSLSGSGNTDVAVLRYLPDGTLDPAFGTGGIVLTPVTPMDDLANAVAIQSDGRIVVAGRFGGTLIGGGTIGVLRYLADGTLDPSFGAGGVVQTAVGTASGADALVIQPDGRIVVVGTATLSGPPYQTLAAVRYEPDGTIEPGFGIVKTRILEQPTAGHAVALAPDGKIVAAGEFTMANFDKTSFVIRYGTTFPVCWDGVVEGGEQCDDGNFLDGDCCSSSCQLDAPGTACTADTDPCTTDLCDGAGTCRHDPGNDGAPCDDGDICTTDTCQAGACVGAGIPLTTCREPFIPRRGTFLIRDNANPLRDTLIWRWRKGEETSVDEFAKQDYTLCVYDASAAPQPVAHLATDGDDCGAFPCWQPRGAGQIYTDTTGSHDGLTLLWPTAGIDGRAGILLRAGGLHLVVPSLPLTPPVTVQLHDSTELCWSAGYASPRRNDSGVFKATAD